MSSKGKDDHSGEEVELALDRDGKLSLYKKKKWKEYYVALSGGALYVKKTEKDNTIQVMIKLKGAKVEATTDKKKENCFVIEADGETHLFSAENDASVNEWVASIKENLKKEPGEAGKGSKMKQTRAMKAKKSIGGKVATSQAGKAMIRDFLGPDIEVILKGLKKACGLVEKKKSSEIESNIIRLSVKVIILYRDKVVTDAELLKIRDSGKELWMAALDMLEMSFAYDQAKLANILEKLSEDIYKTLKIHISDDNLTMLKETFDFLSSVPVIEKLFVADETEKMRSDMCEALRRMWNRFVLGQPEDEKKK